MSKFKIESKHKIITISIVSLIGLFTLLILISLVPKKENGQAPAASAQGANQRAGGERNERGSERPQDTERGERGSERPQGTERGERAQDAERGASEGERPERGERGERPQDGERPSGERAERGSGRQPAAGGQGRNAAAVRAAPVVPGTIERSVIINGEILARNQVTIFPTVGGRLVEIRRSVGDRVNRGDIVAFVDPSRPGEIYARSPVVSTVSGTILNAPYSIGDTISTQSGAFVVGDLSLLMIETHIAERFVTSIEMGMNAELWFEAIPGEKFTAEVTEINPVLDPATRTLRIRLRFIDPDPRIRAGMFATISLVTSRKVDVPVIQRISVINTYGSWIVFIVDENNTARRREVTLGIENEEFVEITGGLAMGDMVITAGQNFLSDGDAVRVVE